MSSELGQGPESNEHSFSLDRGRIYRLAEKLLVSQDGFCPTSFFSPL